jgi:hypothetical protein
MTVLTTRVDEKMCRCVGGLLKEPHCVLAWSDRSEYQDREGEKNRKLFNFSIKVCV